MNTLLNRLACSRHSAVDLICVISDIEGKLMEIAAFEKLRINCIPDDDGFTDNDYQIFNIAENVGEAFSLDFIPGSYKHYLDDVILLGKSIGRWGWDSSFQHGVQSGEYTNWEFSSEGRDVDEYINGLGRVN